MAFRSGIGGSFGLKAETKYGEFKAITKFWQEIEGESLAKTMNFIEVPLLASSMAFLPEAGHVTVSSIVGGDVTLPLFAKGGMGSYINQLHGNTVTPEKIEAGKAYKQIHKIGTTECFGKSLSVEVGRPEVEEGKVKAFKYAGLKVTGLTVSCATGDIAKVSVSFMGQSEKAEGEASAATYATGLPFTFQMCEVKVGGTKVGNLSDVSVAFTIPQPERYRLGNEGLTSEPILNALMDCMISATGDFSSLTNHERYVKGEVKELQVIFTGANIDAAKNPAKVEVKVPAAKLVSSAPQLAGPDIVQEALEFKALKASSKEPVEVEIVSEDSEI